MRDSEGGGAGKSRTSLTCVVIFVIMRREISFWFGQLLTGSCLYSSTPSEEGSSSRCRRRDAPAVYIHSTASPRRNAPVSSFHASISLALR